MPFEHEGTLCARTHSSVTPESQRHHYRISAFRSLLLLLVVCFGPVLIAQPLQGTYTVNNGGSADFSDLGAALSALQSRGIGGATIFEVYDDGGTYTSNSNYSIGYPSLPSGMSAGNSSNSLTIRAAAGESPVISGVCGVGSNSTYNGQATIGFSYCHWVTLEGLTIQNGNYSCVGAYSGSNQVTNITIRNCEIRGAQSGPGIWWYGNGSIGPLTVENCFIHSNNCGGYISSYSRGQISMRRPNNQTVIRNNTIVCNRSANNSYASCVGITAASSTYYFADFSNNICISTVSGVPVFYMEGTIAFQTSTTRNNLIWQANGATFSNGTYSSYSSWTNAGYNSNGVNQDPMLASVQVNSADYEIQAGSPAIDAGASNNLTDDIEGDTRPSGGGIDIGCDERVEPIIVTPVAKTRDLLYANAANVTMAQFTIENASPNAATMTNMVVEGDGTGDHNGAYASIALYRDANANQQFDLGTDVSVSTGTFSGTPSQATFTFTGNEADIASMQTNEYFIVATLSGAAVPGTTLDLILESLTLGGMATATGVPSMAIEGVEIDVPDMTITDVSATSRIDGILNSTGNVLQAFTVSYPNGPTNAIGTVELQASGSGDDSSAFSAVHLYRDDGDGNFDEATDTSVANGLFTADDGTLTLALMGQDGTIMSGNTETFFVVADFNLAGNHNDVFQTQVISIGGVLTGTNLVGVPSPSTGPAPGINLLGDVLLTTINNSGMPTQVVDNDYMGVDDEGFVLLDFYVQATNVNWSVAAIRFEASGTGNDLSAFSELQLYEDFFPYADYDPMNRFTAGPVGTSFFDADNGIYEATLTDTVFTTMQRHFFLVGKFAGSARVGETFKVRVESFDTTPPTNGLLINLPSADGQEFEIDAAAFDVTFHGPMTVASINNTSLAQTLLDFTVATTNEQFTITDMTFTASGSGHDVDAISEVALYLDADGNGAFEFANDTLATTVTASGFSADNGTYVASLSSTDFTGPTNARFFLVISLNGTALSGDTFAVTLSSITATSPSSLAPTGVPTMTSAGVIIDNPVLTIGNSPVAPMATVIEKTGADFTYHMGSFMLTASNGDITVSSIVFNTTGTGDWVNDIAPVSGFQLFLDDGNGLFDASSDTMIFESPGVATAITATFAAQTITNNSSITMFVQTNVLGSAGGATPSTYVVGVNSPANVNVPTGVNVMFGAPAPTSASLTVIEYFVDSFTPTSVLPMTSGQDIVIEGSGFTNPVSLTIGGVPALGFGNASPDGTTVTGFTVPDHSGTSLEIVLTTSLLGPRTLTQRFSYAAPSSGGGGGGGCAIDSHSSSSIWVLLALGVLASGVFLLRRQQA